MKIIDGHDVIEHAEVNGEDRAFIRKLTDYIEDADVVEPKTGDLISREDAIKAIFSKPAYHGSDGSWYHSDDIRDAINSTPSADRPQGEWIIHKINGIPHTAECSCCHNHYDYEDLRRIGGIKEIIALPYCPDCGARMKGADDE